MKAYYRNLNRGVSIIEAILGISILSLALVGAITTFNLVIKTWSNNVTSVQSSYLMAEGMEVVYYLRDSSWSNNIAQMNVGTKYYLNYVSDDWATSTIPTFVDGKYDRYVILGSVSRDVIGNIAASGTTDNGARLATVYVGWWNNGATTTVSFSSYVFNVLDN